MSRWVVLLLVACGASTPPKEPVATHSEPSAVVPIDATEDDGIQKAEDLEAYARQQRASGAWDWHCYSTTDAEGRTRYTCLSDRQTCTDFAGPKCTRAATVWCFASAYDVCQPSLAACRTERDAVIAAGNKVGSECAQR